MYKIFGIILTVISSHCFAAAEIVATVSNVRADKSGVGYIMFSSALGGTPASCINGHANHLAFDLNTPGGQGIMSLALAAQASGKYIKAKGSGSCDIISTVESWQWGYVITNNPQL